MSGRMEDGGESSRMMLRCVQGLFNTAMPTNTFARDAEVVVDS